MNRNNQKKNTLSMQAGNISLHLIRIVVSLVFIFSGFVKLDDPLGFTYKIEDYLTAFGGFMADMSAWALPVAIGISTFELLLGLSLLFQIKVKPIGVLMLLFMLVMTPLTLWIALKNPVTDCGCFGDALVITNWQTFFKNVILLVFILIILSLAKHFKKIFLTYAEWLLILVFIITGIGIAVYSLRNLPIIDFLPYKTGTNIPEAMYVPDNAPKDKYETTFIYEQNGIQKEFTLENYPKGDSTWKFIDQKTVLISEGYKAPIHNFSVVNEFDEDITEDIIFYPKYTYLLTMYDLNKTSIEGAIRAEKIYQKFKNSTTKFYALTAAGNDEIEAFRQLTGVTYPFCKADPITLKTMVRSNPGLMLIKNSVIVGKWSWRNF